MEEPVTIVVVSKIALFLALSRAAVRKKIRYSENNFAHCSDIHLTTNHLNHHLHLGPLEGLEVAVTVIGLAPQFVLSGHSHLFVIVDHTSPSGQVFDVSLPPTHLLNLLQDIASGV